jgi:hypothetical protein
MIKGVWIMDDPVKKWDEEETNKWVEKTIKKAKRYEKRKKSNKLQKSKEEKKK